MVICRRGGLRAAMHRRLIQLTAAARTPFFLGIVSGFIGGLCSVAQAYLLSTTVDGAFLRAQGLPNLWPGLRLLLGIILVRGFLSWVQEVAASEVGIRVRYSLRDRLFAHILKLGPGYASAQNSGELTAAAVDGVEALDAYYGQYLPQLVVGVLVPLTILALVFPIDPLSGGILLITAPLIPFFMYMIGRTAEQSTSRQYATLGRLSSHLLDSIQGLSTLKIFGQSKAQIENIAGVADTFRKVTLQVLQLSFLSAFALEFLATISTALIAVEVALRLLYGHMDFQPALFLLILAPEFYMPLRLLGARYHASMEGTAAARRIFQVLDTALPQEPEEQDQAQRRASGSSSGHEPAAIRFSDVSYTYPGRNRPALEDIDLSIAPGSHVAIVGASGAGKSTIASLLLGFIRPTSGQIWIGDASPAAHSVGSASVSIGWVPQAAHLFHDSIAGNIRLGKPNASVEEVMRATRLAHLDGFVETLPAGLETIVGEGGARLSDGERQRLALARAFLLNAPTMLLDEPSSSQDPENEALLEDSLQNLGAGRTVVTIAHRLNTIKHADQIIVLDGGRIVEQGTHPMLLAAGGAYSRLVAASRGDTSAYRSPTRSPLGTVPAQYPVHAGPILDRVAGAPAPSTSTVVIRQLLGFIRGSWNSIALSVLLATLTIGSSVALMGTSAWLISAAALHPSIAVLQVAIVGVRLFGISRAVFRYFERLVSHGITFKLLRNIRVWFYAHLEPLAPARLTSFHAGDLISRAIADVETLENMYVRVLGPALTAVALGAAVAVYFWVSDGPTLAGVLAAGFVVSAILLPLSAARAAQRLGARIIALRGRIRSQLIDSIQGSADILAFGRDQAYAGRLTRIGRVYASAQRSMARISGAHSALSSVTSSLCMWLVLVLGTGRVAGTQPDALLLAPFALIMLASFEAVSGLPRAGQLWPGMLTAARRLFEIASMPPAVADSPIELSSAVPATRGGFEFKDVAFTYPDRAKPALQNVSLSVERGERVALVGSSGAGKSTVGQLLLRFWEYEAGDIRVGGQSVRTMLPDDVRALVGHVSQHPYLFDNSLRENLRFARRGIQAGDLELACSRAGLQDFIQSLPDGYDTPIGEHGAFLSAGERQRIGIARVILKDAPILILDEPTANLDAITAQQVLDALFEISNGKACLFITHRLQRMDQFHRIIMLDHGRVVEVGTHRSLMEAAGLYSQFWTLQNGAPA